MTAIVVALAIAGCTTHRDRPLDAGSVDVPAAVTTSEVAASAGNGHGHGNGNGNGNGNGTTTSTTIDAAHRGTVLRARRGLPDPSTVVDPAHEDDRLVDNERFVHATWSKTRPGLLLVTLTGSSSCHPRIGAVMSDDEHRLRLEFAADPRGPRDCTMDLIPYTTPLMVPSVIDVHETVLLTVSSTRAVEIVPLR